MKISYATLESYFEKPLPGIDAVSDAFTFHSFEIDDIEGDVLDIKVLPNRANDCSSDVGIARQLSAILDARLKKEFVDTVTGTIRIKTSLKQINATLGADFPYKEVEDVFRRLRFQVESKNGTYIITPPGERTDLNIPVDIAEEVGQIIGYDKVPATELPPVSSAPDQSRFNGIERMKDQLVEQGYTEVSTQSFAKKGDIHLANPLDENMPALRTSLDENMKDALERAKYVAPLVLAPGQKPKLFEIGTVFTKDGEHLEIKTSEPVADMSEMEDDAEYVPVRYELGAYKPFSTYPFITRDIALWTPSGTESAEVMRLIRENASELLMRLDQFDTFEKEGRVSCAYRLVFQSMERTLTNDEINGIMAGIATSSFGAGYEVR